MEITNRLIVLLFALTTLSCGDEEVQYEVPATYEFLREGESTVSYTGQTERILMAEELAEKLLDFSSDEALLLEMFYNETADGNDANPFASSSLNESTKSVRSKVAASFDFFSANTVESAQIKSDFDRWIKGQVTEIFPYQMVLARQGFAGQLADGTTVRYVNAQGLEYNQAVVKSLIGALMVDQMLNNYLSSDVLDQADNRELNDQVSVVEGKSYTQMEHKWDEAYGYLFGKSADSTNPLVDLGVDEYLNKYLSRVENDADFTGISRKIFDAFKLGRAAIVNKDYETRDEQAEIIKEEVSKVIGIRAVYYLQQGKLAFPEYGTAFHDLSEGFGFIYSLRFTRKPNSDEPYFTKEEVDGYLDRLLSGDGFWSITAETLDEMSESIADKFEFTVAQAGS